MDNDKLVDIMWKECEDTEDGMKSISFDKIAELLEKHKGFSKERVLEIINELAKEQEKENEI